MATFDYLNPGEILARGSETARDFEKITGLKAVSAERFLPQVGSRTAAGYLRKPSDPWRAHAYVDRLFKVIDWVRLAPDADAGMAEVFYTDGTSELISKYDLLCVERPVTGPEKNEDAGTGHGAYEYGRGHL